MLGRIQGTLPQTNGRWLSAMVDLSSFAGRDVKIRFAFDTGDTPQFDPEGWYVDDVLVAHYAASVCGLKWHDANGNAAWEPGEPGLNAWSIYADTNRNGIWDRPIPGVSAHARRPGLRGRAPDPGSPAMPLFPQTVLQPLAACRTLSHRKTVLRIRRGSSWMWPGRSPAWPVAQPTLRVDFREPMQTISLDFAAARVPRTRCLSCCESTCGGLLETVEQAVGRAWETVVISERPATSRISRRPARSSEQLPSSSTICTPGARDGVRPAKRPPSRTTTAATTCLRVL